MSLFDSIPVFTTDDQRVDWAGERIWDVAEGNLDSSDASFLQWWLAGLCDDPAKVPHARQQFRQLLETLQATMALRWPR